MDVFSAAHLLRAPKKKKQRRPLPKLANIRKLQFSPLATSTPKKAVGGEEKEDPLEWGISPVLIEAEFLAESGEVRDKFLLHSPEDVAEETDVEVLEKLWELYFPPSQPHNNYEEAYLSLMRDSIDLRLSKLSL